MENFPLETCHLAVNPNLAKFAQGMHSDRLLQFNFGTKKPPIVPSYSEAVKAIVIQYEATTGQKATEEMWDYVRENVKQLYLEKGLSVED